MGVPILAWILCIALPLTVMLYAFFVGLPYKEQRRKRVVSCIKEVPHGISMTLTHATVYDDWYTEANLITCVGFYEAGAMIVLIGLQTCLVLVPFMFVIYIVSDWLDGRAATAAHWDCHSTLGAIIDPWRDRMAIPLVLLSIYSVLGIGLWVLPAFAIGVFESCIGYTGRQAQKLFTKTLNTHGPGMLRQIVHLLMVELMLVVFYLVPLPAQYPDLAANLALFVMAVASYFASVEYRRQFADMDMLYHEEGQVCKRY